MSRFTKLRIGNQDILPGNIYLSQDIAVTQEIKFHEKEKSFSLEFSALNFEPDNTATYSYRLLGFEDKWVQVPGNLTICKLHKPASGNLYPASKIYARRRRWSREHHTTKDHYPTLLL